MANCHHRRVPLLAFAFTWCALPFFLAIAALFLGSHLRGLFSRPLLQPSYDHLRRQKQQVSNDDPYFLRPGAASLRGRRPFQEDRLLCAPHLPVRHPVLDDVSIDSSLYGVFDGHLGDKASDFAARSITESFLRRTASRFVAGFSSSNTSLVAEDLQFLEAALLAAISDIDVAFAKFADTHSVKSGSTACITLQVRDQILVANVGDSKAFLCSSCHGMHHTGNEHQLGGALRSRRRPRHHMSREAALSSHSGALCAQTLSSDHRPDRPDEKLRIEASGGFVTNDSLPRVNGQLAVSRSIGDVDLQKYGVISEPELSGWRQVADNDQFLILASDGIFEKLSPQEVCNVLHALGSGQDLDSIIHHLEKDTSPVIALPGVSSSKASSGEQDPHVLGSASSPLTSSSAHIATVDACQGDTVYGKTRTPLSLQDASGIAQIMAQILVEIAYRAGSMDNLSAIIVPLKAAMG